MVACIQYCVCQHTSSQLSALLITSTMVTDETDKAGVLSRESCRLSVPRPDQTRRTQCAGRRKDECTNHNARQVQCTRAATFDVECSNAARWGRSAAPRSSKSEKVRGAEGTGRSGLWPRTVRVITDQHSTWSSYSQRMAIRRRHF